MKKGLLFLSLLVLVFLLSSCAVPRFESLSVPEYADPRKDVEISWIPSGIPDEAVFYVYLDSEEIGYTKDNTFTIPAEKLDWGEEYVISVEARSAQGDVLVEASATFKTYEGALKLHVVDANSGPAVEGATVFIDDEEAGETDSNGEIELLIKENPVNILLKKEGYALSAVKGLKVHGEMDYKVLLRKAQINPDPDEEELPVATVTFYTDDSKETVADLSNATSLYVHVEADGKHMISIIYAAAGKIPGAGFFGKRLYMPSTNTAEGFVDLSGLDGEIDVHVVVYDTNDNRVDYVFYANIVKEGETTGEKYEVLKWSDYGYTDIDSYTVRRGLEFYSLPVKPKKKGGFLKNLRMKPLAAPAKNSNLWVEVWFIDYDTAADYGLIDASSVERPEAYIIYKSFDGISWEKAGVVAETDDYDIVFRDSDPRLSPGKKVYYKIAAYYPDGESTPVDLGYVVPLDTFNVQLLKPEDGSTNVSRDPTFIWKPTSDAFAVIPEDITYDGSYVYTLWIYDLVQSENHLFPYDPESPLADDVLPIMLFYSNEATEMSLEFSSVPWAIIAYDYGGAYLYPYDKLEPNKTYEWAVDLAYAYATFNDGKSSAYSIAIDEGYNVGYWLIEGDIHNTFTTGQE